MSSTSLPSPVPDEKPRFWSAPVSYWVCQGLGWGFLFSEMVFAVVTGMVPSTARKIPRMFLFVVSGILLTHLVRYLIRRQDWRSLPLTKLLGRGFLAALLVGAALRGVSASFNSIADHFGLPRNPSSGDVPFPGWGPLLWLLATDTFTILVWEAIYFQAYILRRLPHAEAERWKVKTALASAELGALKAQLNPHFLFNCLNSLHALIPVDPARAQHLITRLASLLRYSLQSNPTPTVSLKQELQPVADYLDLEAFRFKERLRVRRVIDPVTLGARVPPMVVQTVVENAIKYDVSTHPNPGEIEIVSRRENGNAVVAITSLGQIEPQPDSTGSGLQNATDRLLGPSASITLTSLPNDLVTATIRIPLGLHTSVKRDSVEPGEDLNPAAARRPTRPSLGPPRARDESLDGLRRARSKHTVPSPTESESGNQRLGFWDAPASYWICQGIGWILLHPTSFIFAEIAGLTPSPIGGTLRRLVFAGSGILLTHLLRYVIRRQDWRSLPLGQLFRRGLLAALLLGATLLGVNATFDAIANYFGLLPLPRDIPWPEWGIRLWILAEDTFTIAVWQAIYFHAQIFRRHRRTEAERWKLEAQLASAELRALRAQLNPHFLFNCLNSLRALILENPGRARHVITRLASLLSYSLQSRSNPTVSLARELETVDDYLDLEAIRFDERLRVRREVDPATFGAQVPLMVVQTLVENAIKYGVSKNPDPGEIEITSRRSNDEVVVVITNKGQIESQSNSTGIGLQNATDRLHLLLGQSASITLAQAPNDLVTATLRIPLGIHTSVERDSVEPGENSTSRRRAALTRQSLAPPISPR